MDVGRGGGVNEEQRPLRIAQCIEIDDPRWRLFASGLHRRVLLDQRGAQGRHVVEDEIERGVEQPAGAHGRLDEPLWKFEGCERQLSDLGRRIVLRRHGASLTQGAIIWLFMPRRNVRETENLKR